MKLELCTAHILSLCRTIDVIFMQMAGDIMFSHEGMYSQHFYPETCEMDA